MRLNDFLMNVFCTNREEFTRLCLQFQWDINKEKNDELLTLLSEREALENDVHLLDKKNNALQNSMLAFAEEIIEELHNTNSGKIMKLYLLHYSPFLGKKKLLARVSCAYSAVFLSFFFYLLGC